MFYVVEVELTAYNGYYAKTWDHEILRTVYKKADWLFYKLVRSTLKHFVHLQMIETETES